jgi:rhodanese-related sulfurtransferase
MKTPQDLVAAAKARIREVPVNEAEAAIANADLLIDVREASEFANGHLPNAVHASRGMLEFQIAGDPDHQSRDLKIVLYCKSSGRAALAAVSLQELGYQNVVSITGGYDAWVAAGKPVVQPNLPEFG